MVQSNSLLAPHPDELLGSLLARRAWAAAHNPASFVKSMDLTRDVWLTLPLFRVALNPRFTRPFYAVPRTSAARTASG